MLPYAKDAFEVLTTLHQIKVPHQIKTDFLTWYTTPGLLIAFRMVAMLSAAFTGTVDFSTTILNPLSTVSAMLRAAASTNLRSAALFLPWPYVLVGVLTLMKMISASRMAVAMSAKKGTKCQL